MGMIKEMWSRGRLEIEKSKVAGGYKFSVGGWSFVFLRCVGGGFTNPGLGTVKTLTEARTRIINHVEKYG